MFERYEKLINQTGPEFYTEFMQPLKKTQKIGRRVKKRRKKGGKTAILKNNNMHSTVPQII